MAAHRLLDVGLPFGLDDLEQAAADDVDGAGEQVASIASGDRSSRWPSLIVSTPSWPARLISVE